MIGEVNPVTVTPQFLQGLYRVGQFTTLGVRYEYFIDAVQMVPVIYRRDINVFWHITWPELLNLAMAAGIDGRTPQ